MGEWEDATQVRSVRVKVEVRWLAQRRDWDWAGGIGGSKSG